MHTITEAEAREKRLKNELLNFHMQCLSMRGWFGRGFVAIPTSRGLQGPMLFRKNKRGDWDVQSLENVGGFSEIKLKKLRERSKLELPYNSQPYLPTKRKWNYRWQWLIPISEYRLYAKAYEMHVLSKEELRKRVGHQEPPREPAPRRTNVMPVKDRWHNRKSKHNSWR